jgi:HD-GYP domain-containing protein (c-di-GMP phosphodiesterase class II)
MKEHWVSLLDGWVTRLVDTKKELLLVFSIIAFAVVINLFVTGQRLVLTFYNLPTLFAAFYFGRRRAVQTALASVLVVVGLCLVNPFPLVSGLEIGMRRLIDWADVTVWAGFLLITAYGMGTLYEYKEQRMRELRETYYGVLQILTHLIGNDKYTQNHSYRVSVYATQIARHLGLAEERVEDVRAAALLHDIGKLQGRPADQRRIR